MSQISYHNPSAEGSTDDEGSCPQPQDLKQTKSLPLPTNNSKKTKDGKLWKRISSKSAKSFKGLKSKSASVDTHSSEGDKSNLPAFHGLRFCYPLNVYKNDYKNISKEIIAGIIISFAQVPESISFAQIANLPPIFGLHSAWFIGGFVALTGGRPGMISGATGGMGAILGPLMIDPDLGINYLPYIVIFSGILVAISGACGVGKLARLIPQTVMIGFLNGLAIIIFKSQFHLFEHTHSTLELMLCLMLSIVTFLIVQFLPKITKKFPSSLAGIGVACLIEYVIIRLAFHEHTPLIGDISEISGDWPQPFWLNTEYFDDLPSLKDGTTWQKLMVPIILVTLVSIIEDAMTMDVVTELTHTKSKHLERHTKQQQISMGIANIFGGILSTMGGHGAIGLSMVSCHSGSTGVYRISGLCAFVMVLIIVMLASPIIDAVPASALVGIMIAVVFHTFEWRSLLIVFTSFFPRRIRKKLPKFMREYKIKRGNAMVILIVTVLVVVVNLAYAVLLGIVLSCLFYTWQSGFDFHVHKEWVHKHHMRDKRHIRKFSDFHIHYDPLKAAHASHSYLSHHGSSHYLGHHHRHSREPSVETMDTLDPHHPPPFHPFHESSQSHDIHHDFEDLVTDYLPHDHSHGHGMHSVHHLEDDVDQMEPLKEMDDTTAAAAADDDDDDDNDDNDKEHDKDHDHSKKKIFHLKDIKISFLKSFSHHHAHKQPVTPLKSGEMIPLKINISAPFDTRYKTDKTDIDKTDKTDKTDSDKKEQNESSKKLSDDDNDDKKLSDEDDDNDDKKLSDDDNKLSDFDDDNDNDKDKSKKAILNKLKNIKVDDIGLNDTFYSQITEHGTFRKPIPTFSTFNKLELPHLSYDDAKLSDNECKLSDCTNPEDIDVHVPSANHSHHDQSNHNNNTTKKKFNSDYILIYHFEGPLFFGNCRNLLSYFSPQEDPDVIEIHLRDAYIYDFSAMNALNQVGEEYKKLDKTVHLRHIDTKSHKLIAKANHLVKYFTYEKDDFDDLTKHRDIIPSSSQQQQHHQREFSRSKSLLKLGAAKQFRFRMNTRYV